MFVLGKPTLPLPHPCTPFSGPSLEVLIDWWSGVLVVGDVYPNCVPGACWHFGYFWSGELGNTFTWTPLREPPRKRD